jgi:hypothetical protein
MGFRRPLEAKSSFLEARSSFVAVPSSRYCRDLLILVVIAFSRRQFLVSRAGYADAASLLTASHPIPTSQHREDSFLVEQTRYARDARSSAKVMRRSIISRNNY